MDPKIRPGSKVTIETAEGKYTGILMERPELADKEHVVIKLASGYNMGIRKERITSMKAIPEDKPAEEYPLKKQASDPKKSTVAVIATGGTIASRVDYLTGGVHSAFTAEELVSAVPEIENIANIKARQAFNKFSENMAPADWIKMAQETYEEIRAGAAGVVITHGTDTMHYTSAALAFMLKPGVPVILTGAQRSSDRGSSDAAINFIDSVSAAAYGDFAEVCVLMHGESSDSHTLIHPGTKVRKLHTSRRDAFQTVNDEPIGKVENGKITYTSRPRKKRGGQSEIDAKIDEKVSLLKYHPGMKPRTIDDLVKAGCRGIVFEGTGLGHVSETLFDAIKNAIASGVPVAMTSQTLYGRVDMNVYSTGRMLLSLGVIPCHDMLPETACVKMMWVLGHTRDPKKAGGMMQTNYAGEINDRTLIE
ncbi:MAG: Glu-tRNA(Gln) amidotransferase subunit GatD [Candidatus Altiarchaeota archaeon]|nr:Glu-tRNA(Gln) amidotransferase subunit GatD [Candidatus Altiarchaeota archaeon]